MATQYRIFANDYAGGPVDYSTPVATVSGSPWTTPAIPVGSDVTFAVRTYDSTSGLDDGSVDAAVRIVTNGSGADVTNVPAMPSSITATPRAGGQCRVDWVFVRGVSPAEPTAFDVFLTTGSTVTYSSPVTTVSYINGQSVYSANLTGLSHGVAYTIGVRPKNGTGNGTPIEVGVTGKATGPDQPESIVGSATFGA